MKEVGLNDYLVLLSLCHTCRYRGIIASRLFILP